MSYDSILSPNLYLYLQDDFQMNSQSTSLTVQSKTFIEN